MEREIGYWYKTNPNQLIMRMLNNIKSRAVMITGVSNNQLISIKLEKENRTNLTVVNRESIKVILLGKGEIAHWSFFISGGCGCSECTVMICRKSSETAQ